MMQNNLNVLLDKLSEPGLDYVLYWPKDEGGCANTTIALKKDGEYAGLASYLAKDTSSVDYVKDNIKIDRI
jgi:hypothetical protein